MERLDGPPGADLADLGRRLRELTRRGITAVCCFNDLFAASVTAAATRAGLDVPADLAVVGIDDEPLGGLLSPALTTVRFDYGGVGAIVGDRLRHDLDGEAPDAGPPPGRVSIVPRASAARRPGVGSWVDPATLTLPELRDGLRAGATSSYPAEAAVELLIRHRTWLTRPSFVRACVCALLDDGEVLAVDWSAAQHYLTTAEATPAERAVGLIAVQLGAYPDPTEAPIDAQEMPLLAWLLPNLGRGDVDLVLAAISHAAGTHYHADHVGEPAASGEWHPTPTSPRLWLGPVHTWPDPAVPLADQP